jgi:hypothetical protein
MRPFSPLIKLFILPVYQELTDTVRILDLTNRKLDYLYSRTLPELEGLQKNLKNVNSTVHHRIDVANDYIQLLHHLSHNIVVELTKLKIEQENLKIKLKIVEKEFEFLKRKEKALERTLYK